MPQNSQTPQPLVVADASPLITAARARKLDLVKRIYSEIIIPPAVYEEIVIKGRGRPGSEEIKQAPWIKVREPKDLQAVNELEAQKEFHPGESQAIILAQELPATLLADEILVLKEARQRGLKITSTLLMLELAKHRGLITSVKKELADLSAAGFRASPSLLSSFIKRVGEE